MAPARRVMQFTLEPGESAELGTFVDGDGNDVTLAGAVDPCGGPAPSRRAKLEKNGGSWTVRLSPDASIDVEELVDDKGTTLRITVVARGCPGGEGDDGPDDDWSFGQDVAADVAAERAWDPDIAAEE